MYISFPTKESEFQPEGQTNHIIGLSYSNVAISCGWVSEWVVVHLSMISMKSRMNLTIIASSMDYLQAYYTYRIKNWFHDSSSKQMH